MSQEVYDPKNVKLTVAGIEITGFSVEDSFITLERDAEILPTVGIARDIMGTPLNTFKREYACDFIMDPELGSKLVTKDFG